MLVVHSGDADVAIGCLINKIDEGLGALLLRFVADKGMPTHVGVPKERDNGIEHGKGNVLAFTVAFTREQSGSDRLRRLNAREFIGKDSAYQARSALVAAGLYGGQTG